MIIDPQTICARFKKARLEAHLRQEQAAKYLQVPISAISAIECGKRKVDAMELFLLSKLYKKPLSWFFGEEEKSISPIQRPLRDIEDPIIQECFHLLENAPTELCRRAAYGVIGFLSDR